MLEALKGSIGKWERIVAGTGSDEGIHNCPLCQKFYVYCESSYDIDCAGCPVAKKVGVSGCVDTPYREWTASRDLADAKRMLEFLKSLLPVKD